MKKNILFKFQYILKDVYVLQYFFELQFSVYIHLMYLI
jgi:hypothetical protein